MSEYRFDLNDVVVMRRHPNLEFVVIGRSQTSHVGGSHVYYKLRHKNDTEDTRGSLVWDEDIF